MFLDILVYKRAWHSEHQKLRFVVKRLEDNGFEPSVKLLWRNVLRNERKSRFPMFIGSYVHYIYTVVGLSAHGVPRSLKSSANIAKKIGFGKLRSIFEEDLERVRFNKYCET